MQVADEFVKRRADSEWYGWSSYPLISEGFTRALSSLAYVVPFFQVR